MARTVVSKSISALFHAPFSPRAVMTGPKCYFRAERLGDALYRPVPRPASPATPSSGTRRIRPATWGRPAGIAAAFRPRTGRLIAGEDGELGQRGESRGRSRRDHLSSRVGCSRARGPGAVPPAPSASARPSPVRRVGSGSLHRWPPLEGAGSVTSNSAEGPRSSVAPTLCQLDRSPDVGQPLPHRRYRLHRRGEPALWRPHCPLIMTLPSRRRPPGQLVSGQPHSCVYTPQQQSVVVRHLLQWWHDPFPSTLYRAKHRRAGRRCRRAPSPPRLRTSSSDLYVTSALVRRSRTASPGCRRNLGDFRIRPYVWVVVAGQLRRRAASSRFGGERARTG